MFYSMPNIISAITSNAANKEIFDGLSNYYDEPEIYGKNEKTIFIVAKRKNEYKKGYKLMAYSLDTSEVSNVFNKENRSYKWSDKKDIEEYLEISGC